MPHSNVLRKICVAGNSETSCKVSDAVLKQKKARLLMAFFRSTIRLKKSLMIGRPGSQFLVSVDVIILRDQTELLNYEAISTKCDKSVSVFFP